MAWTRAGKPTPFSLAPSLSRWERGQAVRVTARLDVRLREAAANVLPLPLRERAGVRVKT